MRHYTITFADALEAHERALAFGGRPGIVNENSIRSAIGRPYSGYHDTLPAKAAALLHAVVQNHGFTDGNKRTALLLTTLLIRRSGAQLTLAPNERFDDIIVAVASGEMTFDTLHDWFTARIMET